jgi:hypothetical protein
MANPKFYELQRLRKSTWDTPRFIRGYDLTPDVDVGALSSRMARSLRGICRIFAGLALSAGVWSAV